MIEIKEKGVSPREKRQAAKNEMSIEFDAISTNESFARIAVASFVMYLNPTLEELSDIKTAVSEAVTNAIIHGYENIYGYGKEGENRPLCLRIREGKVYLRCKVEHGILTIEVEDKGVGIENVDKAMEPLYTSKPQLERSGMGFSFMEAFMDELEVESVPMQGTIVRMQKKLQCGDWIIREE